MYNFVLRTLPIWVGMMAYKLLMPLGKILALKKAAKVYNPAPHGTIIAVLKKSKNKKKIKNKKSDVALMWHQ